MVTLYTINNKLVKAESKFFGIITEPTPPGPTFDEVTIGTQTWMSKNLTIDDGQGGIFSKVRNYGQGDVVEYYYNQAAAIRIASSISGWHLPTKAEFTALEEYNTGEWPGQGYRTAGKRLKSTYGWTSGNGNDNFGFCVLPAGYFYKTESGTGMFGEVGYLIMDDPDAKGLKFNTGDSVYFDSNNMSASVRLIKDS